MQDYTILTDSACDLTEEMLARLQIPCIPLNVFLKDAPTEPCPLRGAAFYHALRSGQVATTSAPSLSLIRETMEKELRQGRDVLYLAFSSALSCTYNTGEMAAEELRVEYPDRCIVVVDSRCASQGQGLFVYDAAEQKAAGMPFDALVDYVTQQRLHTIHWFTVDDLMFLRRGGRLSGLSAVAGTLLGIKPVMYVSNEGKLLVHSKVRGRKQSLLSLAKHFGSECENPTATVFVAHADAFDDAAFLRDVLIQDYGATHVTIGEVGAVIGAHSGPGTIALFYMGKARAVEPN